MLSRVVPLAAAALLVAGCSKTDPVPVTGTQNIVVTTYTVADESWSMSPEPVTTLHDLRSMQGSVADVYVQGSVSVNYSALLSANANTAASVKSAAVHGTPVIPDFDYFTVQGNIYPADQDAENIATAYYELEQAFLFFQQQGTPLSTSVPLYYHPAFTVDAGTPLSVTDLGTTEPWLGFFVVPNVSVSNWEPPALQPGVVAYEYAQAVFAEQVFGNVGMTWLDVQAPTSSGLAQTYDIVRSLDDGFADFFAAVLENDPTFVHTSGASTDPTRDVNPSSPVCVTQDIMTSVGLGGSPPAPRATYDPHPLGTVFAAALYNGYEQQPTLQQQYVAGVIAAMKALGPYLSTHQDAFMTTPLNFVDVINEIVPALPSSTQAESCNVLLDRLGAVDAISKNDVSMTCSNPQIPDPSCN